MDVDSLGESKSEQASRLDKLEQGLARVAEKLDKMSVSSPPFRPPQKKWQTGQSRVDGKPVCFGCGKVGHIKRDCRSSQQVRSSGNRVTPKES